MKNKQALQQSYERIKAYQESIKQTNQQLEESVECYEIYHPLESVVFMCLVAKQVIHQRF